MTDLKNWTEQYDPAEIGRALNTRQWAEFEAVATATNEFVDTARTARTRNNNAGRARRCRRQ